MKILLLLVLTVCSQKALSYRFLSEGGEVVKLQGEDVKFRCEVDGLDLWQRVSWLNGTLIMYFSRMASHRDPRISLLDADGAAGDAGRGNVYELNINSVTVQDEGTFTCQISGEHPIEQKYTLTVNIPPVIRMEPEERSVDLMIGDSVEVMCRVLDGKPTVIVTWSRDDDAAVFENEEDHFIGETLEFEAVGKQHTGTYRCTASNGAGEDVTEEIKLNVMYKPNVTVDSNTMHTGPDRTTEITCHFDANPPVQVSWQHDGADINFEERPNVKPMEKGGERSLVISDVTERDLGVYLCIGGNEKGQAEAVIKLSALPYGLRILSEEKSYYSDAYYLEWQVESVAPLIECNLDVVAINSTGEHFLGNNTIPAQLNVPTHNYQITDLQANGTYKLELYCRNSYGSTPTETLEFYTAEQHRPAPPPTTPSPVVQVEEKTEGIKEMNTVDEDSKVTEGAITIFVEKIKPTAADDPNSAVHPVAMTVANLVLLLMTTVALTW